MDVEINNNEIDEKEISIKNIKLKTKIFDYFYIILNKKEKTTKITLIVLHILEIFQIISYAFFQPHLNTWKITTKSINVISLIIGVFRLTPLLNYATYKICMIILIIFILLIFCFCLMIIMQILFRKENSKIYNGLLSLTHRLIAPLTIFLYIPINELLLIIFRCNNNVIDLTNYITVCWNKLHLFYIILSVFGIIVFLITIIFLNFFYFYPFQTETSTIKLNSTQEIILLLIKLIYIIRLAFINNEYMSIAILLIFSLFLIIRELKSPTYNCLILEIIINIRNSLILWTFLMLLIAKLTENTEINNLIYLVFIGYPIVIYISIVITQEYENQFNFKNTSLNNIKTCLSKTRILIKLINSFIDKNNYNLKYIDYRNKDDILLKGLIKIHTERCLDEECPLKKFLINDGNFNIQKQCLLNYMNIYFNKAMKNFPHDKIIRLYFIQFNYSKKYNLSSVRANLEYIKRMKNNIKDEFIIYYLDNEISNIKNKSLNLDDGNKLDQENIFIQNNYKKLKDLIISSTRLYAEFWGIFSNNLTNNLNISKIYKLGENLNIYLKQINNLWENNLKNKKINVENENIVQLYARFLKEILWDKKSSEEVQKKINEEYHILSYKQNNKKFDSIQNIIENPDYLIFVNSNEKGKCKIFQFSNSLSNLIGYQKIELINKPLETLMPSIFIDGHSKKVEEFIKSTHLNKNSEKESFRGIEKKKTFILIKSKMGYLKPFNAEYTVFDDNDFSNNFIIKADLEQRDAKSMYAYYILTKNDFSVDSISSSAIHLGFSMDLLKKYVINLDILIRTNKDQNFNLFDSYKTYEEEPKKITWVFPDIIYPKNDQMKNKDKKIEELIKISNKKRLNLHIFEMKYKENEIIGFIFKFSEIQKNNKLKNENSNDILPSSYKNEILFDILNLNYIRTILVTNKTGLRNLREYDEIIKESQKNIRERLKETKNKGIEYYEISEESSGERPCEILLTKEKILELQARDFNGIESFINNLPFYGEDIALIRQRPNKEQYIAGKVREPLIRIDVSDFIKRIDEKMKINPSFYNVKNEHNKKRESLILSDKKGIKNNFINATIKHDGINKNKEKDDNNKDNIGDYAITLANIFNEDNINKIKLIDFIVYILIILNLILEFYFTNINIKNNKNNFYYLDNSYKLLNNIMYTKYFITEAVVTNTIPNYIIAEKLGKKEYLIFLKNQLIKLHEEFNNLYQSLTVQKVKFSNNFTNYISYTNFTIITLNNGIPEYETQPFFSILNKLSTAVFYVSTISDLESINMANKYSYELMLNLINVYYSACTEASKIILYEINISIVKPNISSNLIICLSLIISIISIVIFYKIMVKLILDREKPINLFLTMKKNLFEYLKISAENFSNKLLNKFFGNEENEEESQQDYLINIKGNDINIAKFKALHENKSKKIYKKTKIFIARVGQLILFLTLYEIYMILKFININQYFSEVYECNLLSNTTQLSEILILKRINTIKQYFFNKSLPLFNLNLRINNLTFTNSFFHLSGQFSESILSTSTINNFLKKDYLDLFKLYLYQDFSRILDIKNNSFLEFKTRNGFKPLAMEIFENLRCLFIQYALEQEKNQGQLNLLINDEKWFDIHLLLINFIRKWNEKIINEMNNSFYSVADNLQIIYLSIFIVIIILITLLYCIIWKSYEENMHNLLKKSYDLINLIPKEIKSIIVSKLNE